MSNLIKKHYITIIWLTAAMLIAIGVSLTDGLASGLKVFGLFLAATAGILALVELISSKEPSL